MYQKLTDFSDFWYGKCWENLTSSFIDMPTSPVCCSHFTFGKPKSYFSKILFIRISDYLRYLRIKWTATYLLSLCVQLNHNCLVILSFGQYYWDVLLTQELLPAIRSVAGDVFVFHQDNVPTHRARDTSVKLLRCETPQIISRDMWPANSCDLNPVECCICGIMQEVYSK